jgi:uncharacterized protein (DUF2164 family)
MRIRMSGERREMLLDELQGFIETEFDETLSRFRAGRLLDWFVRELGPAVYNQAIRDAHGFIAGKLEDLEGELYEPEER